jgi:hypothetical protein
MPFAKLTIDSYTRDSSRNPDIRKVAALAAEKINDMLRDLSSRNRKKAYRQMIEQFNKVIADEKASAEARLTLMLTRQYMEQGSTIAAELAHEVHAA